MIQSDLLRPSLSPGHDAPASIYSLLTAFLSSFFGGPVGGALITLINAHRLHRLGRDWPLLPAALALAIGLRWALMQHALGPLESILGVGDGEILVRIAGFAVFGLGYLLHGTYHRSQQVLDLPAPKGFWPGLLCTLVGWGLQLGLTKVLP